MMMMMMLTGLSICQSQDSWEQRNFALGSFLNILQLMMMASINILQLMIMICKHEYFAADYDDGKHKYSVADDDDDKSQYSAVNDDL